METNAISGAPAARGEDAFVSAPFRGKNAFWRYFLGGISPFLVSNIIGAIPLAIVMIMQSIR